MLPTTEKNARPQTDHDPHADTAWTLLEEMEDTPVDDLWTAQAELWAMSLATDSTTRLNADDQRLLNCLRGFLFASGQK